MLARLNGPVIESLIEERGTRLRPCPTERRACYPAGEWRTGVPLTWGCFGSIAGVTEVDDGRHGRVELTTHDLRVVARFAVETARNALPIFEQSCPDDGRPRAALEAAWVFAEGAKRTNLQRTSALAAHTAAREAPTEAAREAARAAGHAAAAAYLHPLAAPTQVRHILGAAACAARAVELAAGGDPRVGTASLAEARRRATPELIAVLTRYPTAPSGGNRVAQLVKELDTSLRSG